jgi:hypothetical protein
VSKKARPKLICKECPLLGIAKLGDAGWQVCKHQNFKVMFPDGRTLDLDEEAVPYWCPHVEKPLDMDEVVVTEKFAGWLSQSGKCINITTTNGF